MIVDARANAMLDTEIPAGTKMSLHSAYSLTGANEITGGSYAKQTPTWGAAATRAKTNTANVVFSGLPAAASVAFVGLWDSAGTVFKGMAANGGVEFAYQVGQATDTIIIEANGFVNGDNVVFTGAAPAGLTEGTIYFVVGVVLADPDTFQVAATSGGAAINITGQPGINSQVSKVIIDTYTSAGGTHTITSFTTRI